MLTRNPFQINNLPPLRRIAKFSGPLVALFIILSFDLVPGNRATTYTAAIAAWMAIWWLFEAVPMAITAILPVIIFPLLKIMPGKAVAGLYINSVIFLFLGGFMVALALERWQLHKRLALSIIVRLGGSPATLLMGFMLATAFLSMWISNTATTMMMVPIAMGAISRIESEGGSKKLGIALLLAIAYSASVGGVATLIGTPPNLALTRIYAITFPENTPISFTSWFVFAFPISIIMLTIIWTGLTLWMAKDNTPLKINRSSFKEELAQLGPVSREERIVLVHFVALASLWLTRGNINAGDVHILGWASRLGLGGFVDDGTVAIAVALSLFLFRTDNSSSGRIMDWETAKKIPWNIVLLFGGGFALAQGFIESGLAAWLGGHMAGVSQLHPIIIVAIIALILTFLTEFTSNTATAEVVLPVLAAVAIEIGVHPLMLMVPATISASCAFMMPIATPPNAIVFGTGHLKIVQMAKPGFILNLVGVLVVTTAVFVLGDLLMQ